MDEPLDRPESPLNPPPKMPLGKVVLVNFGIMLLYLMATGMGKGHDYGSIILDAFFIAGQTGINLLGGAALLFSQDKKHIGKAMLLGALLVGLVGFGACLGKYSV